MNCAVRTERHDMVEARVAFRNSAKTEKKKKRQATSAAIQVLAPRGARFVFDENATHNNAIFDDVIAIKNTNA